MTRIDFESPVAFQPMLTGKGGPVAWSVIDDPTAPAGAKVLAQTSKDKTDYRFPLAVFDQPALQDLDVAVRFKPVSGEVDRAAGIAVRLADRDNYYVVRANALEDNVRLYRVVKGDRQQFAGANVKVPSGVWQACAWSSAAPASRCSSRAAASTARPTPCSQRPDGWRCGPRPTASPRSTTLRIGGL